MKLYRPVLYLLLLLTTLFSLAPAQAAPPAQTGADWAIPNGHFFTQTAGAQAGDVTLGFSVVDNSEARFWSEFQRLGGLQTVGYPISRRFTYDGFVTQAFQKLVLQWRPELGEAWPVNVFDELSRHGLDERLKDTRQTPYAVQNFDLSGASWGQIVTRRQGLLDANSAIRARYFSVRTPLDVFGLPVSRVEDMGNHYALRTQRAVFQQWKEAVPWAAQGQVTIANGGDIAKEMGWLTGPALQPESASGQSGNVPATPTPAITPTPAASTPWVTRTVLVGPGTPSRLYMLQIRGTEHRLMLSDDLGNSWSPFAGGLPVDTCLWQMSIDPTVQEGLYANTCKGFYRWTNGAWIRIGEQARVATPGNPQQLWLASASSVSHSEDGGSTWVDVTGLNSGVMGYGVIDEIIVTPGTPPTVYAMLGVGRSGTTILRATPGGTWTALLPEPEGLMMQNYHVVRNPATGAFYLGVPYTMEIWRIQNPGADPEQLIWERVSRVNVAGRERVLIHAAAQGSNGVVFFATLYENAQLYDPGSSALYRSLDGGQSWHLAPLP